VCGRSTWMLRAYTANAHDGRPRFAGKFRSTF
jgi:hypothetical protein